MIDIIWFRIYMKCIKDNHFEVLNTRGIQRRRSIPEKMSLCLALLATSHDMMMVELEYERYDLQSHFL